MWKEPLDFRYWFVNVLAGDPDIFIFLSFIFLASVAAFFKMLNITVLLMFVLFMIIINITLPYVSGISLIIFLLIGLIVSVLISQIVKR